MQSDPKASARNPRNRKGFVFMPVKAKAELPAAVAATTAVPPAREAEAAATAGPVLVCALVSPVAPGSMVPPPAPVGAVTGVT
jgi:hypothetical protein